MVGGRAWPLPMLHRGLVELTPDVLFGWLESAPFGAFAMSMDQTIVFWNSEARSILGFAAGRVSGGKCYQVMPGLEDGGLTPDCADGCACLRSVRLGMVPSSIDMVMRCASGAKKMVRVQPMVVSGMGTPDPLVVYLFGDAAEVTSGGARRQSADAGGEEGLLSARELEVLRYLALGWEYANIAAELGVSPHTVRNHSTNLRRKLDVTSRLEAVLAAMRLGLLPVEGPGEG